MHLGNALVELANERQPIFNRTATSKYVFNLFQEVQLSVRKNSIRVPQRIVSIDKDRGSDGHRFAGRSGVVAA
jgi:hypothetical protein